jgi:diaminopimelate epimerase
MRFKEKKMQFTKMHGLGNDYVYVDCFKETVEQPALLAQAVSDRHTGIGADGLILIGSSKTADVKMRIFNADGSEAEMCGNGIRCVAKYTYEHKLAKAGSPFNVQSGRSFPASQNIETGNGILKVGLLTDEKNMVREVCVNMGQPILIPKDIPVNLPGKVILEQPIEVLGQKLLVSCISMGNPHAVFFCDDVEAIDLAKLGPVIEHHKLFPKRINVHFVQIKSRSEFIMRTWERGSGITMACGTGACASAVASILTNRQDRSCTAFLPGGSLSLFWSEYDNCVYMTGDAVEVFHGIWEQNLQVSWASCPRNEGETPSTRINFKPV